MIDSLFRTHSDGGPWLTVECEEEEEVHVVPDFGPQHQVSAACWCHPALSGGCVIHNVPN